MPCLQSFYHFNHFTLLKMKISYLKYRIFNFAVLRECLQEELTKENVKTFDT